MDWTGTERRGSGSERMKVGKPVSIFAGDKQSILRARTVDLSTGGMRLEMDEGLSVGEKILFRIDLGEGFDPAVQGGEVVWSEPEHGTGVSFSAPEAEYRPAEKEEPSRSLPGAGDAVRLYIDRMDHHLKVECVEADASGIHVRTELPFLERGRNVRASYDVEGGAEAVIEGILTEVSLEPGGQSPIPRIMLEIRTGEQEPLGAEDEADEPEWEKEEPTERDAVPPPEPEEPVLDAAQDEPIAQSEDVMSEPFHCLTDEETRQDAELPIEPRYVIVLRAVSAWLLARGRQACELLACWAQEAWTRLVPWMREAAPEILERARTAGSIVAPLVARLRIRRRTSATPARPMKMRRQKRRTTQMSVQKRALSAISKKARSRALAITLILAAILGFGTGVWGLVSLIASGKDDGEQGRATGSETAEVARGSFDLWGNSALPAGHVVEPRSAEIEVVEAEAPVPEAAAGAIEAAPGSAPVTPAAVAEAHPAIDVPVPEEGSSQGFYLGVSGDVTGYDYYPLKSPPGLVVDVKGALPLQEGGQPVNRPGIKKVKAVARESGARFIIYFEGDKVPDFQVLPAGSTLEVRLES